MKLKSQQKSYEKSSKLVRSEVERQIRSTRNTLSTRGREKGWTVKKYERKQERIQVRIFPFPFIPFSSPSFPPPGPKYWECSLCMRQSDFLTGKLCAQKSHNSAIYIHFSPIVRGPFEHSQKSVFPSLVEFPLTKKKKVIGNGSIGTFPLEVTRRKFHGKAQ